MAVILTAIFFMETLINCHLDRSGRLHGWRR